MLMAVPKYGKVKATRFLNTCRISQGKTIGGLSDRQRGSCWSSCTGSDAAARVIIVSGPSGAGKGTLIEGILPRFPHARGRRLRHHPAASARASVDGRDYHFLTAEEFERPRGAPGTFLEHVTYAGQPLRHAALGDRPHHRRRPLAARRDRAGRGAGGARERSRAPCRSSSPRPRSRSWQRRLERRGTDSEGEIAERLRDQPRGARRDERVRPRVVNADVDGRHRGARRRCSPPRPDGAPRG